MSINFVGFDPMAQVRRDLARIRIDPMAQVRRDLARVRIDPMAQVRRDLARANYDPMAQMRRDLAQIRIDPMARVREDLVRLMPLLRRSFQIAGPTSTAKVWSEGRYGGSGPATEQMVDDLQPILPDWSREQLRQAVFATAAVSVFLVVALVSLEHPVGFDQVWSRINPAFTTVTLALALLAWFWPKPPSED